MQSNNPQFATVTFISGDDTPGNTFRVPITHETTVRQLAKDAMQRLVLSRRTAGHKQMPSIMVTEVFVGGEANQTKAEIFSQDLVTQVVLVKEEVIFMRLQSSSECKPQTVPSAALPTTAAAASTAVLPTAAAVPSSTTAPTQKEPARGAAVTSVRVATGRGTTESAVTAAKKDQQAAHVPRKTHATVAEASRHLPPTSRAGNAKATEKLAVSRKAAQTAKPSTPPVEDRAARATKRTRQDVSPEEDSTIQKLRAAEEAKRLRWGPEASSAFASNYVSSPNRLMSRRKPSQNASRKASATTSPSRAEPATKQARKETPVADDTGDADGFTREGWGPDAYKNFAANYVTSPDRLARLIRQQKRMAKAQEKTAASAKTGSAANAGSGVKPASNTKAPAPIAPKRTVSRQLAFPETDEGHETRQTVGHGVTLIEVDDDDDAIVTEPPKGWGSEAVKYFDAKTYCDDPSKARLTEEERSRPMQTRHSCRL